MDQKKRGALVAAIGITVLIAVFVSFGLPALMGVPEVTLPELSQEANAEYSDFLSVEVTPETVQSVIATMERPKSYYREQAATLYWSGGSDTDKVRLWCEAGYVKTEVTSGWQTQHRLVGKDALYLWYEGDKTYRKMDRKEGFDDLAQRIPTYEDVLKLDVEQIAAAGYETRNGSDCIYVEVRDEELNSRNLYWIEMATGLLYGAETWENDTKVYEMYATALWSPIEGDVCFALPDGTVLYERSGTAYQESGDSED
ncbi:MAG: hypothetical protein HUJ67_05310 [Ruminiclostridium sp.]|nr:hypothetical protein [Ruminiclostridium sp.]